MQLEIKLFSIIKEFIKIEKKCMCEMINLKLRLKY